MKKIVKKKAKALVGGLDVAQKDRPDVVQSRQDVSTYIARVDRPLLNDREGFVRRSYEKGMDLRDIVRGSGLLVSTVFRICGIDVLANKTQYDSLCEFRANLIMKAR